METIEQEERPIQSDPVRLPLWKSCLDDMKAEGVYHGKEFKTEFFEEKLRCKRTDQQFGLSISEIRRSLEFDGFYISGRGQKLTQFIILLPAAHYNELARYSRKATDALNRGVILGTNTRLDTLSAEERRRHESMLEKMAMKAALIRKSGQIYSAVKKTSPKLLE